MLQKAPVKYLFKQFLCSLALTIGLTLTFSYPLHAQSYAQWLATYGMPTNATGSGAPSACPAGDGIPNLMKFGLGLPAWEPGYAGRFVAGSTTSGTQNYLAVAYSQPSPAATGIAFSVEESSDLATWSGGGVQTGNTTVGNVQTITVRDTQTIGGVSQRFIRLKVAVTASLPANTAAPQITGTAQVGQVLSASTGSWTGGSDTPVYTYQWKRNGVNISGATSATYQVQGADIATTLTVVVTAMNVAGSTSGTATGIGSIQPAPSGAYPSTWTWVGPLEGTWTSSSNWIITGSSASGAPTTSTQAYINTNGAMVTASNAVGGLVYVRANTSATMSGVAPVLNFTGGSNFFNNGQLYVGSGSNNYGGVVNQTGGFIWGFYNAGTNNLNLQIASLGSGYTNAVGTFSFGGTNAVTNPAYLGGSNGAVFLGTNVGENGALLLHDYGTFSTYGIVSGGTASRTTTGGAITVAGSGANGGVGTINVTGGHLTITTGTVVFGGVSLTGGTATLSDTIDSTGISTITAANSISLGTNARFNLVLSGTDFTSTVGQVYTLLSSSTAISGTFSGLPEGYYLSLCGYKFKASYLNNKFTLTTSGTPTSSGTYNIVTGGTYSGKIWQSTNYAVAAVLISTTEAVTIINSCLSGPGDLIRTGGISSLNLTVKNCYGYGLYPPYGTGSTSKGYFMNLGETKNLDVENCQVVGCGGGIYVNQIPSSGANSIKIKYNRFKNMDARWSDGTGGYQTTGTTAGHNSSHTIILNAAHSVPVVEIAWNEMINMPWMSSGEDVINMYDSSGTALSPALIHDNYIYGAWPANPWLETYSGGGILMDGWGSDTAATASSFVNVYNNQVVATTNYGLGIAAGHDDNFYNNRAISSGKLPDGTWAYGGNVGIVGWNPTNQPASVFFNNIQCNNLVGWMTYRGNRNDAWCPETTYGNSYTWPGSTGNPTLSDEAAEYLLWVQKLQTLQSSSGVTIGPTAIISSN